MIRKTFITGLLVSLLAAAAGVCNAADWVKLDVDIPNKNVDAHFYDGQSVKVHNKTLSWTEKTVLSDFGAQFYSKHLSQYPDCQKNMAAKGNVTYHQLDLQIKGGNFRMAAKRNYNAKNELICTDKEMGTDLNKAWQNITYQSPMYYRHYELSTKYKIGDL